MGGGRGSSGIEEVYKKKPEQRDLDEISEGLNPESNINALLFADLCYFVTAHGISRFLAWGCVGEMKWFGEPLRASNFA